MPNRSPTVYSTQELQNQVAVSPSHTPGCQSWAARESGVCKKLLKLPGHVPRQAGLLLRVAHTSGQHDSHQQEGANCSAITASEDPANGSWPSAKKNAPQRLRWKLQDKSSSFSDLEDSPCASSTAEKPDQGTPTSPEHGPSQPSCANDVTRRGDKVGAERRHSCVNGGEEEGWSALEDEAFCCQALLVRLDGCTAPNQPTEREASESSPYGVSEDPSDQNGRMKN